MSLPLLDFLGANMTFPGLSQEARSSMICRNMQLNLSTCTLKLTGVTKFKQASTPFLPDGSFSPTDDEVAPHACALVMKQLRLARLARPDLIKAINILSSRIQKWSRNDDKRLYRLTCYLNSTVNYGLKRDDR